MGVSIAGELGQDVPLATMSALQTGGNARFFLAGAEEGTIIGGLEWAREANLPVALIGNGTRTLVADGGFRGLVISIDLDGLRMDGDTGEVTAGAGVDWDALVARSVDQGLAGLESLSGFPGSVGGVVAENLIAFGHLPSESVTSVRVIDRHDGAVRILTPEECGFNRCESVFGQFPRRFVILEVGFLLEPGGQPDVRDRGLSRMVFSATPEISEVRSTTLRLRRRQALSFDRARPSLGPIFRDPLLPMALAAEVWDRLLDGRICRHPNEIPFWPAGRARARLPAWWLMDRVAVSTHRRGSFSLSARNNLVVVHHGGGNTADLVAFLSGLREGIHERSGILLKIRAHFVGDPGVPAPSRD